MAGVQVECCMASVRIVFGFTDLQRPCCSELAMHQPRAYTYLSVVAEAIVLGNTQAIRVQGSELE